MNEAITILSARMIRPLIKKKLFEKNILVDEFEFIKTVLLSDIDSLLTIKNDPPHYIFTSKKAVESFNFLLNENKVALPANYHIYCLDGATKKAVFKARMRPTLTAPSARQLAQAIYQKGVSKKLIFFCSDIRRNDLPAFLSSSGIDVKEIVLYKTLLIPRAVTNYYNAILFFSPSAVQSFFMSNKLNPGTTFFCIGPTTADAVKEIAPGETIIIADKTSQQSVAEKVISHYNIKTNHIN